MIITLWNYKGGVGKSTIALILAEIAVSKGLRTLAVDLDDQKTLTHALNLRHSWLYITDLRGNSRCVALVKNSMTNIKFAADIEKALDAQGYPVAGRLPHSILLMKNIASGKRWDWAMRRHHKQCFTQLFDYIQEDHHV